MATISLLFLVLTEKHSQQLSGTVSAEKVEVALDERFYFSRGKTWSWISHGLSSFYDLLSLHSLYIDFIFTHLINLHVDQSHFAHLFCLYMDFTFQSKDMVCGTLVTCWGFTATFFTALTYSSFLKKKSAQFHSLLPSVFSPILSLPKALAFVRSLCKSY